MVVSENEDGHPHTAGREKANEMQSAVRLEMCRDDDHVAPYSDLVHAEVISWYCMASLETGIGADLSEAVREQSVVEYQQHTGPRIGSGGKQGNHGGHDVRRIPSSTEVPIDQDPKQVSGRSSAGVLLAVDM